MPPTLRARKPKPKQPLGELSDSNLKARSPRQPKKRALRQSDSEKPIKKKARKSRAKAKVEPEPSPEPKPKLDHFHKFKDLPPDIQLKIWELVPAADFGRNIYIRTEAHNTEEYTKALAAMDFSDRAVYEEGLSTYTASCPKYVKIRAYTSKLPLMFQMDRATYILAREHHYHTAPLTPLFPTQKPILINWKKDTIFFEDDRAFNWIFHKEFKPVFCVKDTFPDPRDYKDCTCPFEKGDTETVANTLIENARRVIIQDHNRRPWQEYRLFDFKALTHLHVDFTEYNRVRHRTYASHDYFDGGFGLSDRMRTLFRERRGLVGTDSKEGLPKIAIHRTWWNDKRLEFDWH